MKQAYPTFIAVSGNDYLVYVPDLDIYTEGHSLTDAIDMARDAIGLKGIDLQDDGKDIPDPSSYEDATAKAKEDTEDFDYTQGMLTMDDVDFAEFIFNGDPINFREEPCETQRVIIFHCSN